MKSDKVFIFKRSLLEEDLKKRERTDPIGQWADIVNDRVVVPFEDKFIWEGDVIYTTGKDQYQRPIKQKFRERFTMEPEWVEEKEHTGA